jgi:hypothetical protein
VISPQMRRAFLDRPRAKTFPGSIAPKAPIGATILMTRNSVYDERSGASANGRPGSPTANRARTEQDREDQHRPRFANAANATFGTKCIRNPIIEPRRGEMLCPA